MQLLGTATTGHAALELIRKLEPQLAIVDINMPGLDGISIAEMVRENHPFCKVLILTMSNERTFIEKARAAKAAGYILKNTGKEELLLAIRKIADGGTYFGNEVMETLLDSTSGSGLDVELSERELEVLRLIGQEMTAAEIGATLFISEHTVKSHRKNLLQKTGCKNSVGLVRFAMEHQLL